MLLASLVIAAAPFSVQDNPLAAPVDYTNSGASASHIVRDLAAKTGAKIEANEAMESDLVAIYTANKPLVEAMDAIARVTSGAWIQQGDRYILTPDIAKRNAERNAHEERRLKALSDTVTRLRRQTRDEEGNPYDPSASNLAWADILSRIDAKRVMLMAPNQRVVFASTPNAMQLPLPNITAPLSVLIEQHNSSTFEVGGFGEELPPELSGDPAISKIMQISEKYGGMGPQGKITEAPAKVLLVFENEDQIWTRTMDYLSVELILFNSEGKIIMRQDQQVYGGLETEEEMYREVVTSGGATTVTEGHQAPEKPDARQIELEKLLTSLGIDEESPVKLELPETTTEVTKLIRSNRFGMIFFQQPKPSAELISMVRRPTEFDPLSITDGAYFVAFGKALNAPVAACLADASLNLTYMETPTTASFLSLVHNNNWPIAKTKDWVDISPYDPHDARIRSDRMALEKLIGQYEQKQALSLDEIADYALVNPPIARDNVTTLARTVLMPSLGGTGFMSFMMSGQDNWPVLRLYGSLDRPKRQSLRRGEPVLFGSMNQVQKTHLFPLIYGANANLFNPDPADEQMIKQEFGSFLYRMFMEGGLNGNSYLDEPTEAAPNGLIPQGRIESTIKADYCLKPVGSDGKPMAEMGTLGLQEVSMYTTMQQMMSQMGSEAAGMMPSLGNVLVGERLEMTLTIRPTAQARATHVLNDDTFTDTQAYPLNQLPANAMAAYEAAQKEMSLMQKLMMGFGMGGGREVPPP